MILDVFFLGDNAMPTIDNFHEILQEKREETQVFTNHVKDRLESRWKLESISEWSRVWSAPVPYQDSCSCHEPDEESVIYFEIG